MTKEEVLRKHFAKMHAIGESAIKTVFEIGMLNRRQILLSGLQRAEAKAKEMDKIEAALNGVIKDEN